MGETGWKHAARRRPYEQRRAQAHHATRLTDREAPHGPWSTCPLSESASALSTLCERVPTRHTPHTTENRQINMRTCANRHIRTTHARTHTHAAPYNTYVKP